MQRAVGSTCKLAGFDWDEGLALRLCHDGIPAHLVEAAIKRAAERGNGVGRILPDARLVRCPGSAELVDVKTLIAPATYGRPWPKKQGSDPAIYRSPVERRADSVNTEYLRHAHDLDVEWNNVAKDDRSGPMEMRLRGFGDVVGLCFGTVGEASPSVHKLAQDCAAAIGTHRFASGALRVATEDDAIAIARRQIRRDWGLAAVAGRADYLLSVLTVALSKGSSCSSEPSDDDLALFVDRARVDLLPLAASYDPARRAADNLHQTPRLSGGGGWP